MAENRDDDGARRREEATARYRLAADETLEQLAWCVQYLHRIHKSRIADVIDKNRRTIRREMRPTGG